jgi:hypothetical protein
LSISRIVDTRMRAVRAANRAVRGRIATLGYSPL